MSSAIAAPRGGHVREPGAIEHDADDAAHADHRDAQQARRGLDREHRRQREDRAEEHPPRAAALVLVEAAQHPRHAARRGRPAWLRPGTRAPSPRTRSTSRRRRATRSPREWPGDEARPAHTSRSRGAGCGRSPSRVRRSRAPRGARGTRRPARRRREPRARGARAAPGGRVSSIAMAYPAKPSVYSPASMATAKRTRLAAPSRGRCPSRHRVYATSAQTPRAVDTSASRFASQTRGIAWHGASAKTIVPKSAARGRKLRRSSARTPSVATTHQKSECTWCQKGCGPNTKWSAQSSALGSGRRKRTTRRGSVHHGMTPRSKQGCAVGVVDVVVEVERRTRCAEAALGHRRLRVVVEHERRAERRQMDEDRQSRPRASKRSRRPGSARPGKQQRRYQELKPARKRTRQGRISRQIASFPSRREGWQLSHSRFASDSCRTARRTKGKDSPVPSRGGSAPPGTGRAFMRVSSLGSVTAWSPRRRALRRVRIGRFVRAGSTSGTTPGPARATTAAAARPQQLRLQLQRAAAAAGSSSSSEQRILEQQRQQRQQQRLAAREAAAAPAAPARPTRSARARVPPSRAAAPTAATSAPASATRRRRARCPVPSDGGAE